MKINEIRIGNLINCVQGELKISTIGNNYIQDKHQQAFLIKDCDGITLTEEWLVRAGAKKVDWPNYHLRLGATNLVLRMQGGKCYSELAGLYIGEIESVHQLQNLYFSLTSNELFI